MTAEMALEFRCVGTSHDNRARCWGKRQKPAVAPERMRQLEQAAERDVAPLAKTLTRVTRGSPGLWRIRQRLSNSRDLFTVLVCVYGANLPPVQAAELGRLLGETSGTQTSGVDAQPSDGYLLNHEHG